MTKKQFLLPIVVATLAISVCEPGYTQESNSTKLDVATNSNEIRRVNADQLFIYGDRLPRVGTMPVDIDGETFKPGDALVANVRLNGEPLISPSAGKYPSAFDIRYLATGHVQVLKAYY